MQGIQIRREAQQAYSEWLSAEKWDLFVTLTDPGLSHPEAMFKRYRYFENSINKSLYGNKFWKRGKGIESVCGLERQKRGSVHAHAVIRLPDNDIRDRSQFSLKYWQNFATELGGWSWLEIPRSSEDVTSYVTKYVCKEGELIIGDRFNPNSPKAYSHTILGAIQ